MWPQKVAKIFFAAHAIGNRQHDDAQNERSLSGDEFIPAEWKWKCLKKGVTLLKNNFFKKSLTANQKI